MRDFTTRRRLNILVVGSSRAPDRRLKAESQIHEFAHILGEEIMRQGHNLVSGCSNEFDRILAEAAYSYLLDNRKDISSRITCFVIRDDTPVHNYGNIIQSNRAGWNIGSMQLDPPELIRYAQVVILIGGYVGTYEAANWARFTNKPLLPLAVFKGTAEDVYRVELERRFQEFYGDKVSRMEYQRVLSSINTEPHDRARLTINLAERLVTPSSVFIIMSFTRRDEYRDLCASIQRVCRSYGYEAQRVDESNLTRRIIPEIIKQIRQSAFVVADITENKPNVYYELGFAQGSGKELILTAEQGTELPFDINDIPVLYWGRSFVDFENSFDMRVQEIATWHGRE